MQVADVEAVGAVGPNAHVLALKPLEAARVDHHVLGPAARALDLDVAANAGVAVGIAPVHGDQVLVVGAAHLVRVAQGLRLLPRRLLLAVHPVLRAGGIEGRLRAARLLAVGAGSTAMRAPLPARSTAAWMWRKRQRLYRRRLRRSSLREPPNRRTRRSELRLHTTRRRPGRLYSAPRHRPAGRPRCPRRDPGSGRAARSAPDAVADAISPAPTRNAPASTPPRIATAPYPGPLWSALPDGWAHCRVWRASLPTRGCTSASPRRWSPWPCCWPRTPRTASRCRCSRTRRRPLPRRRPTRPSPGNRPHWLAPSRTRRSRCATRSRAGARKATPASGSHPSRSRSTGSTSSGSTCSWATGGHWRGR